MTRVEMPPDFEPMDPSTWIKEVVVEPDESVSVPVEIVPAILARLQK